MRSQLKLEILINEALQEEAERLSIPAAEKIWSKIVSERAKREKDQELGRKKTAMSYRLVAAILVVFLASGAVYLAAPAPADALNRRIFRMFVDMLGFQAAPADVSISMSQKSPPPADAPPPPPDWPLATGEKVVSVDEAKSEASFSFLQPAYLPKGLELDIITVLEDFAVNQYYRSDKEKLVIRQDYLPGDFASNSFFANAQVKKVNINGTEGTLVVQHNPFTGQDEISILWLKDNINFRVETNIKEREALKIVKSLE